MNQHNGLRRKLEKYAIPNLTLYLIICYGIGYLMQFLVPAGYQYLMLDPFLVLKGQVWRLVTWILIPPDSSNIFFVLITLYLYYSLGGLLERIWGTYKYNVYLFSGLLFTILGAFVLCGYSVLMGAQPTMYTGLYLLNNGSAVYFGQFSTYYINMSIFLACAASIPDVQVLLMFLFPIKVKWLGIVYGIILLVNCIQGGIATWIVVIFSLLNFLVFFLRSKGKMHLSVGQIKRQQEFHQKMRSAGQTKGITRHKCAICGRTELDGDDLEFRFCSKCNGNYEYCQYHLFTHEHVK
ncbi:hypothetical protein DWW59_04250 [Firmicutes bacterium AF16-15]|jgi:hypothetical protein|nr:hypothetical protein DWW59_04250 [Firmicutes bacterium AF16-15]